MNFGRFLKTELVSLELNIDYEPPPEQEALSLEMEKWRQKKLVLRELCDLFGKSREIRNPTKFFKDFVFREKQASTGIGRGLAIPHLRSMQARKAVTILARSREGVEFQSADDQPVHLFFGITSPPYDDSMYLQIFQWIARAFNDEEWLYDALMEVESSDEAIRLLRSIG